MDENILNETPNISTENIAVENITPDNVSRTISDSATTSATIDFSQTQASEVQSTVNTAFGSVQNQAPGVQSAVNTVFGNAQNQFSSTQQTANTTAPNINSQASGASDNAAAVQTPAGQTPTGQNPYAQYSQPGNPYWNGVQPYGFLGYAPTGVPYVQQPEPQKKKKPSKAKKFFATLGLATLFGIVAAGVFILAIWLSKKYIFTTEDTPQVQSELIDSNSEKNSKLNLDPVSDKNQQISSTIVASDANTASTDVSEVVENVIPAIVSIDCTFNTSTIWGTYQSAGAGSGIILKKTDKELLIATNSHVISDALTIKVTFNNAKSFDATLKGKDGVADLAVISIPLADIDSETLNAIKVATLGNSDDIKVGQLAIAIGNSLGYGQSVTVGYISAKDREVTVDNKTMILLQTDAAINPGNSGGALLNINGEVIGINSVKYADSTVEGMGFAIPISRAFDILTDLSDREILTEEERGYLGVYIDDVTADFAKAYNWPQGIYVTDLVKGGAAEKAGILRGDIITGVNGISVMTSEELQAKIQSIRSGQEITVNVSRMNSGAFDELEIKVVLLSKAETDALDTDSSSDNNNSDKKSDKDTTDPGSVDPGNVIPDDRTPDNGGSDGYYYDPFSDYDDFFSDPFSFFGW